MKAPGTMKALIIEDSPEFFLAAAHVLEQAGFEVLGAENGTDGLDLAAQQRPDLVILDLGLPDIDGLDVCRRLRTTTDSYIVMVTGRRADQDLAAGFAAGADDYITKPFSAIELDARIGAVMRRSRRLIEPVNATDLRLDEELRTVAFADAVVELTKTEFRILEHLVHRSGEVASREALAEAIWGTGWDGVSHAIDAHVSNLRSKLRDLGWTGKVVSVRGVGLRLVAPELAS